MTFVLKHKGPSLIQEFWKDDIQKVLKDILSESKRFFKQGKQGFGNVSIRDILSKLPEAGSEILDVSRVMPKRMQKGFTNFHQDILLEMEKLQEPREKAVFCIKVLGVLTSFTLSTFHGFQGPRKELSLGKLRLKNAFAQFLVTEFILRTVRLFLSRFLGEMEKQLTSENDLEQVRYFRRLLEASNPFSEYPATSEDDSAFRVVDRLRFTILNGNDEP